MRMQILYEGKIITTDLKETILVKDLISSLSKSVLKDQEGMLNIKLLNEDQKILEANHKIEANRDERKLYLITIPVYKRKASTLTTPLEELIREMTGGKTKLTKTAKVNRNDPVDRMAIIEQMLSSGLPGLNNVVGVPTGSINNRMTEINMIQDMLRGMISSRDMQGINTTVTIPSSQSTVNVVANESHLSSLKEMGFPEDRARRALIMARNNLSRATDLLLNDALDYEQQPQRYE
jgi:hypothetical protein